MIHEILKKILEGFDIIAFFAALFYSLVGMGVRLLMSANKRDVNSTTSPVQFSYGHLLKDNAIRIAIALAFIAVFLRFSTDLFGQAVTSWLGFLLGLVSDALGGWLQRIAGGFKDQVTAFLDRVFPPKK